MSGILCVCSAVEYFSFGCFHCEKPFASPLTEDAFICAGFRDAICPASQGNQMPAQLFPLCLPPQLTGSSPEDKIKILSELLVAFPWFGELLVHVLSGNQIAPAGCWCHAGCPGWGGSGQPGLRVLRKLSRLLAEFPLNSRPHGCMFLSRRFRCCCRAKRGIRHPHFPAPTPFGGSECACVWLTGNIF